MKKFGTVVAASLVAVSFVACAAIDKTNPDFYADAKVLRAQLQEKYDSEAASIGAPSVRITNISYDGKNAILTLTEQSGSTRTEKWARDRTGQWQMKGAAAGEMTAQKKSTKPTS